MRAASSSPSDPTDRIWTSVQACHLLAAPSSRMKRLAGLRLVPNPAAGCTLADLREGYDHAGTLEARAAALAPKLDPAEQRGAFAWLAAVAEQGKPATPAERGRAVADLIARIEEAFR